MVICICCLSKNRVDGFSRNRGQNSRITRLFGSFVSSQVFVYEWEFSKTAKQQYHFHDSSYSPSQMAEVSQAAGSCGQFALNNTIKPVVESELPASHITTPGQSVWMSACHEISDQGDQCKMVQGEI